MGHSSHVARTENPPVLPKPNPPKMLVIIPAYNEQANIANVINTLRQHVPHTDIAVVNDGSYDETGAMAQAAGAIVLHMPYNVGIGAAVQTAFMFAHAHDYEVVVRSDGDGQHDSVQIQKLVDALQTGEADMVVGTRFIEHEGYQTSIPRRAGILILSTLISAIIKQPVTDPTSGFAAFNRRTVRLFARNYPHDYPEPEGLVVAHRAGLRIHEVPVTMKARQGGQSSITSLRSVYYMLKVTLAIIISLLRKPITAEELPE